MPSHSSHQASILIFCRWVARIIVAASVAVFVIMVIHRSIEGRGFLSSVRRTVFLEARRQDETAQWVFTLIAEGNEGMSDLNNPAESNCLIMRIQESSMGRTNSGGLDAWRASHWFLMSVADVEQICYWTECSDTYKNEQFFAILDTYMRDVVIPKSAALNVWPDIEPRSVSSHLDDGLWTAYQDRYSWSGHAAIILISLGVGVLVSMWVLPRHPRRSA